MSSRTEIQILVNGEPSTVVESQTVADLLGALNLKPRFVAVERNEELVPRALHSECRLMTGDRIEIVTLVGGG
jgi:sulfur carrier protein